MPRGSYESCSTKKFLRGRTEAIRSTTDESVAFAIGFDAALAADDVPAAHALLAAATARHTAVSRGAASGQGVDRHLFAMLSLAAELDDPAASAPIFTDPAWTRFNTSVLSTSNVNSAALAVLGFGAVCPQGYGLGYTVADDMLKIGVSNFVGDPDTGGSGFGGVSVATEVAGTPTDADRMAAAVEQALLDIERVGLAGAAEAGKL